MSTVAEPKTDVSQPPANDPYYYGFRDEPVLQPDGSYKSLRIALTLEDHLHPHEGDHFVEDNLHDLLRAYLRDVCRMQLQHDPGALILSNTGVYWDDPDLGHHAPDVTVIFGIRRPRHYWPSFHVAAEGTRPRVIFEMVSPRYRKNDVETKLLEYHQAQVPIYVIFDQEKETSPFVLRAFRRQAHAYVPMALNEAGRLWLADLNVFVGVDGMQIICYDATGREIGDFVAMANKTVELRSLAEIETNRAETEKSRAEAEKSRAEAEKNRAEAAEARLRELGAELERLKNQPTAPS